MRLLLAIALLSLTASLSFAGERKEVKNFEAQKEHASQINLIKTLMQNNLPEGCELVSINHLTEFGVGETYAGNSTLITLLIQGEEVELAIPHVNPRDNNSSLIRHHSDLTVIADEFHKGISLLRYQHRLDEIGLGEAAGMSLQIAAVHMGGSTLNHIRIGLKQIDIQYNAKDEIGSIYYSRQLKDPRGKYYFYQPKIGCKRK